MNRFIYGCEDECVYVCLVAVARYTCVHVCWVAKYIDPNVIAELGVHMHVA